MYETCIGLRPQTPFGKGVRTFLGRHADRGGGAGTDRGGVLRQEAVLGEH